MKNKPIVVICTTPDFDCAQQIAHMLIEKKLAACCNIVPGITSIYNWQDKIQEDKELMLFIKSTDHNFNSLQMEISRLHPYDVPEIISFNISKGSEKYLDWIFSVVKEKNAD